MKDNGDTTICSLYIFAIRDRDYARIMGTATIYCKSMCHNFSRVARGQS
jgi:hypothetical protein